MSKNQGKKMIAIGAHFQLIAGCERDRDFLTSGF